MATLNDARTVHRGYHAYPVGSQKVMLVGLRCCAARVGLSPLSAFSLVPAATSLKTLGHYHRAYATFTLSRLPFMSERFSLAMMALTWSVSTSAKR